MFFRMLLFFLLFVITPAKAENISIAAAADLRFAMDELVKRFKILHPGSKVTVIYGSSGKFYAQIRQGAPYDLYFSADINYPRDLVLAGSAGSEVIPYAVGRIVLWTSRKDVRNLSLNTLIETDLRKIAIANPKHAPYGKRAEEVLKAVNVWESVKSKLVFGENIAQAAQFVQTGHADAGLIAYSLVLSPAFDGKGAYFLVPDYLHAPLEQGFVVTKRGAENPFAKIFSDYMKTDEAREIMRRYGFSLPSEHQGKK